LVLVQPRYRDAPELCLLGLCDWLGLRRQIVLVQQPWVFGFQGQQEEDNSRFGRMIELLVLCQIA